MKWYFYILLFGCGLGLPGCEEEVQIDLDESERRVVIEGWINDKDEVSRFSVSYTTDFFGSPEPDYISGARLVVRDDRGQVDTLVEVERGIYETQTFIGQQNTRVELEAEVEGTIYTAANELPRIGTFTTVFPVYTDTLVFGEGWYIFTSAQEAPGVGDFYQFRIYRNDSLFDSPSDFFVIDDRLVDGQESPFLYPYPHESGDTVVVEVRAISRLTYDYYITYFQQANGSGGPFGSPPDNLLTNIDNDGLGFFGAAAVARDTVIIP